MKPVTLVLVGAVGSGKSTFSQALVQNSRTEWRRVNQDSLKSRQRCEKAAKQTLASSACVIIDRMNFDAEQRAHWVKLASEFSSPCYVLCLKYPAEVCAARGSQRSQHEGGVMGDQASKLAFMMSKSVSENMPTVAEGFEHVIVVKNDEEVAIVLNAWQEFNPQDHTDPSLVLTDIRPKLPRSALICKGDTPFTLAGTKRDFMGCSVPQAHSRPAPPSLRRQSMHTPISHKSEGTGVHPGVHKAWSGAAKQQQYQAVGTAQQPSTTATPNHLYEVVEQQPQHGDMRVPLSATQQRPGQPSASNAASNARVLPANLRGPVPTQVGTTHSTQEPRMVLANEPNQPAVAHCTPPQPHQAAPRTTSLSGEKRRLPASLLPGADITASPPIRAPGANTRTAAQDANSMRSATAPTQVGKGQHAPVSAVQAAAVAAVSTPSSEDVQIVGEGTHGAPPSVGHPRNSQKVPQRNAGTTPSKPAKPNAFNMMMTAARSPAAPSWRTPNKRVNASKSNPASKSIASGSSTVESTALRGDQVKSVFGWRQGHSSAWHDAFIPLVREPEKHMGEENYIWHDDRVVMLKDQYPKARFHMLVIARESSLLDISCLRSCHIPLLAHMRSKAEEWFQDKKNEVGKVGYCFGFHWQPSMKQLHLHAISRDFDSTRLKHPKHYRSFCSDFFRDVDDVMTELKDRGSVHVDFRAIHNLMKAPMSCLWCQAVMPNLPAIKRHIGSCLHNPEV